MNLEARVIADSISPDGVRLTTVEATIHRFVLAELNTHGILARSAQSSRAVPVANMIKMVRDEPLFPVHWGKQQSGMQAKSELSSSDITTAKQIWLDLAKSAADGVEKLNNIKLHKQVANRPLETYLPQKVVMTATEWENFEVLRDNADAQPEMRLAAVNVMSAIKESKPNKLGFGRWHMPYITTRVVNGVVLYQTDGGENTDDIEVAKRYSAARCATTSYRTNKVTLLRAVHGDDERPSIFSQLADSAPRHSVPLEHVARPMICSKESSFNDILCTHIDRGGWSWSGRFRGWGQFRKEYTGATLVR